MIVVGTATVNDNTGKVELRAPLGFGAVRALRLSNFNADAIILTNISGVDQSQEYLQPQQQMVYQSINVGNIPTLNGLSLPPTQIASNLLVEWSTDPTADFIGTYPVGLPSQISSTNGTSRTNTITPANTPTLFNTFVDLGAIPTEYGSIDYELNGAGNPYMYVIQLYEGQFGGIQGGMRVSQFISGTDDSNIKGSIPFKLAHFSQVSLLITPLYGGDLSDWVIQSLANANSNFSDVPLVYTDVMFPVTYAAEGFSIDGTNNILLMPNPADTPGSDLLSGYLFNLQQSPQTDEFDMILAIFSPTGGSLEQPGIIQWAVGTEPPVSTSQQPLMVAATGDGMLIAGDDFDRFYVYRRGTLPQNLGDSVVWSIFTNTLGSDVMSVYWTLIQVRAPYSTLQNE